ncbi:MAG: TPM domain-containing protein [Bacteroidales bacterium]|jgi:uncharacterized protein|nr:TPM domain-containing protein [Bacteroidales bacterium]
MNRVMKSLLAIKSISIIGLLFITTVLAAQIPAKPVPPRLVNDFASILSATEAQRIEEALVAFSDSTSNQIVIVSVNSLEGIDKAQFAYNIGAEWKVGQNEFNNGVVILIKPKKGNEKGEAFIATGYGLEGALPDAICKRIVEQEMIPRFRDEDYFGGVIAALNVIMPIAAGEYTSDEYAASSAQEGGIAAAVLVIIFVIAVAVISAASKKGGGGNYGGGGKKGPGLAELLLLGSLLSGGRSRSGGFGGGFGGSGGFGGGGFGGFGGGGFGGGGAGGSW